MPQRLAAAYQEPVLMAFDALPADADEPTWGRLAEAMVGPTRRLRATTPPRASWSSARRPTPERALALIEAAEQEMNNPAQLDVLQRLRRLRED